LVFSAACVHAEPETAVAGASEGEKLERQMVADIKAKDWKAVESRIAEGFQSVHPDGVRDRAGEIALLKKMEFGDFTLGDFKSTTIGDNVVVTFTMTIAETNRRQTIGCQTGLSLERVGKRGEHLAMDLPCQSHSDSLMTVAFFEV